jgi:hypothetical protein
MNRPAAHVYVEYSPQFQAGVGKSPSFTKLGKGQFYTVWLLPAALSSRMIMRVLTSASFAVLAKCVFYLNH